MLSFVNNKITSIKKHGPPMRSKKIHHLLQVLEASASEEASGENNANAVRKPGADRLERCVFFFWGVGAV